jgi:hypothetical protein
MFTQPFALQESNRLEGIFREPNGEATMKNTGDDLDALLEVDRFVRLMAAAPGPGDIVSVVRAYLSGWSKERIVRLQATDAGWVPFDEHQQPFPIASVSDVRQIAGPIRIRFRELRASDIRVVPELLELDLFFFFADESLAACESDSRSRAQSTTMPSERGELRQSAINRDCEHRI